MSERPPGTDQGGVTEGLAEESCPVGVGLAWRRQEWSQSDLLLRSIPLASGYTVVGEGQQEADWEDAEISEQELRVTMTSD